MGIVSNRSHGPNGGPGRNRSAAFIFEPGRGQGGRFPLNLLMLLVSRYANWPRGHSKQNTRLPDKWSTSPVHVRESD